MPKSGTRDPGLGTRDWGPGTWDPPLESFHLGTWTQDPGPLRGTQSLGPFTWDPGPYMRDPII